MSLTVETNGAEASTISAARRVVPLGGRVGVRVPADPSQRHIVFLLHGIRTQGEWSQRIAGILESESQIRARPIRYEFFDVVRFLLPISSLREQPVRRVARLIRDELSRGPASLSIVAHSFGTYIVARLLAQETDLRFHRLILCGSIVHDDFDWERYGHRLDPDRNNDWQALNDCSMDDLWPVLAQSVTWGYGSSGRFGFGHPRVKDRYFKVRHSGFFDDDFVRRFWLPYLADGEVVEGSLERPTTSWWISAITVIRLRYVVVLLVLVGLATVSAHSLQGMLQSRGDSALQVHMAECRDALTWAAEDEAATLSSYSTRIDPAPRVLCERLLGAAPDNPVINGYFARALIMDGHLEEAIARLERAAQLGDARSNLILGHYFLLWRESNRSKGIEYLNKAAELGSSEALLAIGKAYELGTLAAPDYTKAAAYYQRASAAGVVEATFRLAELYRTGLGVKEDREKAKTLYRLAAGVGHEGAVEALNELSRRR